MIRYQLFSTVYIAAKSLETWFYIHISWNGIYRPALWKSKKSILLQVQYLFEIKAVNIKNYKGIIWDIIKLIFYTC